MFSVQYIYGPASVLYATCRSSDPTVASPYGTAYRAAAFCRAPYIQLYSTCGLCACGVLITNLIDLHFGFAHYTLQMESCKFTNAPQVYTYCCRITNGILQGFTAIFVIRLSIDHVFVYVMYTQQYMYTVAY